MIAGASSVGVHLAETLAHFAEFEVVLVDQDAQLLRHLSGHLSIGTHTGHPAYPQSMEAAGADQDTILVAVDDDDEVNVTGCVVGKQLFNVGRSICRLRSLAYQKLEAKFEEGGGSNFIDVPFHPEKEVVNRLMSQLVYPGASQVFDFAGGAIKLVGVSAREGGNAGGYLVGRQLRELADQLPGVSTRVAVIYRRGMPVAADGETAIEHGDEVFFLAASKDVQRVIHELLPDRKRPEKMVIAGGGLVGELLAKKLSSGNGGRLVQVKVIEKCSKRCEYLSEQLQECLVLAGSATDRDLLISERVGDQDVFCGVTDQDEINIMSSLLAKSLGARSSISLINNRAYVDALRGGLGLDTVIDPASITAGQLLAEIRGQDIVRVHSLRDQTAEALEVVVPADAEILGRSVEQIAWPDKTYLGAIIRGGSQLALPKRQEIIQDGDHLVFFMADTGKVNELKQAVNRQGQEKA